jgi:hypothetical protein
VDLTDPTRALTPTLDGPVLAVLARAGRPLTVGQIAIEAARGSEIGIRRSVARLVEQGIVKAYQMGRNQVLELNRDHVAAPAAEILAGLRLELWNRLRELLAGWDPRPVYGCVFGSAARADGDAGSDIDILLVHRPFADEPLPAAVRKSLAAAIRDLASSLLRPLSAAQQESWEAQIDELHARVLGWSGNRAQVVDVSVRDWWTDSEAELFDEIKRDAITLIGVPRA